LLVLAGAYAGALGALESLTGRSVLDGVLGVGLGLFICSQPAANAVDALFYDRYGLIESLSGWRGRGWLAMNGLVLLAGWLVITLGATQLVGH
jgi:hypothetical protein